MQIIHYITDDYRNQHTSFRLIQYFKLSVTQSHRTSCTTQFEKRKQQMTCADQTFRLHTPGRLQIEIVQKRINGINQRGLFRLFGSPKKRLSLLHFVFPPKKKTTTVFRRPLTESRTEIPISANNNNHIKANVATLTASLS